MKLCCCQLWRLPCFCNAYSPAVWLRREIMGDVVVFFCCSHVHIIWHLFSNEVAYCIVGRARGVAGETCAASAALSGENMMACVFPWRDGPLSAGWRSMS